MKILPLLLPSIALLLLGSCANSSSPASDNPRAFTFGEFSSSVPHAPKLTGYKKLPTRSVAFRDAVIDHPTGKWTVSMDEKGDLPVLITTASGKTHKLAGKLYPEEGGADAAGVYAFIKGDETVIILQGTSDFTYEETHIRYQGDEFVKARKYAVKGAGMGDDAPGIEPKYRVYPPGQ